MKSTQEIFTTNLSNFFNISTLNKKDFAEAAQIARTQLDGYLSGEMYPSFEVIDRLAGVLRVPPSRLFEDPKTTKSQPDIAIPKVRQALQLLLEVVDGELLIEEQELIRLWRTFAGSKEGVFKLLNSFQKEKSKIKRGT